MKNNQRRRGIVPQHLREPYVPEYQRLNIEPEQAVSGKFISNAPIRRGLNAPPPNPKAAQGRPPLPPIKTDPRTKMPVHVGNHQDHLWQNERVTGIVDNNDEIDVESLQGLNPLEQEEYTDFQPGQQPDSYFQEQQFETESNNPNINDLQAGQYLIFYKGEPISDPVDEKSICQIIEQIITEFNISTEEMVVVKRVHLGFGVIIK